MPFCEIRPGVYYSNDAVRILSRSDIERFCAESLDSGTGKVAVCLHGSAEEATYHEILYCWRRGCSFPAHLHRKTDETKFIVFGDATLFLYDEMGSPLESVFLSAENPQARSLVRVPAGIHHFLRVDSGVCAYYEVKLGPFDPEDNVFLSQD